MQERDELKRRVQELEAVLTSALAAPALSAPASGSDQLQELAFERDRLRMQLDKLQQHLLSQEARHTEDSLRADEKHAAVEAQVSFRGGVGSEKCRLLTALLPPQFLELQAQYKREMANYESRLTHGKSRIAALEQQLATLNSDRDAVRLQVRSRRRGK